MRTLKPVTRVTAHAPQQFYEPLPLDDCLRDAKKRIKECKAGPTVNRIAEVCAICRSAWAGYLNEWVRDRDNAERFRSQMEKSLQDCLETAETAIPSLSSGDKEEAQHYMENIKMRVHLANILHTHGREAMEVEMKKYIDQALECV